MNTGSILAPSYQEKTTLDSNWAAHRDLVHQQTWITWRTAGVFRVATRLAASASGSGNGRDNVRNSCGYLHPSLPQKYSATGQLLRR